MKNIMKTVLGASAVMLLSTALYAGPTDVPVIQQREQNQQKRIDQGVKSGELTPREAGKLEAKQAQIKQDEVRMKSDGKLTAKERRKLKAEENRSSRDIHRKKHNDRKADVGQ
jgi:hypothetical protein